MTQEALASEIGLSRTSIVNIERGRQQLLLHTLAQISAALSISLQDLLPSFVPGVEPVLKAISMVPDKKARAWIERSVKSAMKLS